MMNEYTGFRIGGLTVVVLIGLEVLSRFIPILFESFKSIPVKGKHLDELSTQDITYISINKLLTVMFVYHMQCAVLNLSTIEWSLDKITILNTLFSLAGYYIFYDFFYTLFHRFLHLRWLYPYIHKHHHRQKAPSRGNLDAINVHPFEFLIGEYLHLLVIYMIPAHIITAGFFILAGGVFASLNHTRYDVTIPFVYSVKVHDVHHRLPESNYGQYTMLWDQLFGSYRSYDHNINVTANKDD